MGTTGPAPNPTALRRSRDRDSWRRLPPHGLTTDHDIPPWPMEIDIPSTGELSMWTRLWREKPVAWEWLRYGLMDQVAMYVRYYLRAADAANGPLAGEVRRQAVALWLDIDSMRKAKMDIDPNITEPVNGLDAPELPADKSGTVTRLPSTRDRMRKRGEDGKGPQS